jgi:hypothetical protein
MDEQQTKCGFIQFTEELNSDICYNMDEPWHYAKWNKPDTKRQIFWDYAFTKYLNNLIQRQKVVFKENDGAGEINWYIGKNFCKCHNVPPEHQK